MKLLLKGLIICFLISFITNINVNASEEQERLENQLQEIGIEDNYSENIADYVYYYVLDDKKIEEVVQRGEKIASTVENKSSLTDFKFNDLKSIYNDFNFITKALNLKLNFNLRDMSIEIKEKNNNTVLIKANLEQISGYYNNYVDDFAQDGIMNIVKDEKKQKEEKLKVVPVGNMNFNNNNLEAKYNNSELAKANYIENKRDTLKDENNENLEISATGNYKSSENEKSLKSQNVKNEGKLEGSDGLSQVSNNNTVNINKEEKESVYNDNIEEGKIQNVNSSINESENSTTGVSNVNRDKKDIANILNDEESNEVMNDLVYTKDNVDTLLWIAVMIIALIGVLVSAKRLIRG